MHELDTKPPIDKHLPAIAWLTVGAISLFAANLVAANPPKSQMIGWSLWAGLTALGVTCGMVCVFKIHGRWRAQHPLNAHRRNWAGAVLNVIMAITFAGLAVFGWWFQGIVQSSAQEWEGKMDKLDWMMWGLGWACVIGGALAVTAFLYQITRELKLHAYSGIVADKWHEPAHTTTQIINNVPIITHHDDEYWVSIEDPATPTILHGEVMLDETDWSAIHVGDKIDDS